MALFGWDDYWELVREGESEAVLVPSCLACGDYGTVDITLGSMVPGIYERCSCQPPIPTVWDHILAEDD